MSTVILRDGSVVVRLAWQTVHLDVRTRAIHLRAPSAVSEPIGDILESFPQVAVDRVRILRQGEEMHHLMIELRSGRSLSLGHVSSHERAMETARVVADLTRCKVEISEGLVLSLPGPSAAFSRDKTFEQDLASLHAEPRRGEEDPFDETTNRMMWEADSKEEAPTAPRFTTPQVEARTQIVIGDEDANEDPLDYTACRPASRDEAKLRVAESNEEDAA